MRSRFALRLGLLLCAIFAALLPACENGGNFSLFGYSTQSNFRPNIHTVRVPIFKNLTFYQGMEFDLTRAVIRQLESTPHAPRVVGANCPADTELTGTIMTFTKGVLNENNVNEVRDIETTLTVQLTWRDLRTGEYLSKPPRRPGEEVAPPPLPVAPGPQPLEPLPGRSGPAVLTPATAPTPATPGPNNSITLTTTTHYVPELGQSTASSMQVNISKMARQIVELMEAPW